MQTLPFRFNSYQGWGVSIIEDFSDIRFVINIHSYIANKSSFFRSLFLSHVIRDIHKIYRNRVCSYSRTFQRCAWHVSVKLHHPYEWFLLTLLRKHLSWIFKLLLIFSRRSSSVFHRKSCFHHKLLHCLACSIPLTYVMSVEVQTVSVFKLSSQNVEHILAYILLLNLRLLRWTAFSTYTQQDFSERCCGLFLCCHRSMQCASATLSG